MNIMYDKVHILYGKPGPAGVPDYIGKTSGEGEIGNAADIDRILRARDANHHMNKKGFGKPELLGVSENPSAVRGGEQIYIDRSGGAKSTGGSSSNAINSISKKNPKRAQYLEDGKKLLEGE